MQKEGRLLKPEDLKSGLWIKLGGKNCIDRVYFIKAVSERIEVEPLWDFEKNYYKQAEKYSLTLLKNNIEKAKEQKFSITFSALKTQESIPSEPHYIVNESAIAKKRKSEILAYGEDAISLVEAGDIIRLKPEEQAILEFNVEKRQPRWGRYIVRQPGMDERHNLSTIFKSYGSNIVGITTESEQIAAKHFATNNYFQKKLFNNNQSQRSVRPDSELPF